MRVHKPVQTILGAAVIALFVSAASMADTETWTFDLQTTGADTQYTSPTNVCNMAPEYEGAYELTLLEVSVSYFGFPFGPFNVTDQVPPEHLSGSNVLAGPPPFVIVDNTVRYPEEPAPASVAADILMEVDGNGFGHVSAENITLGTATYDVGPPFGEVTVQIESIRIAGVVHMTPLVPADLDGDGDVDLSDLATLLANYGIQSGAAYEDGDLNGDGAVTLSDLAELLGHYGQWDC